MRDGIASPKPSGAWKEPLKQKFLEETDVRVSSFDQCRFGLRSLDGIPHKKPTCIASSSSKVSQELEGMFASVTTPTLL